MSQEVPEPAANPVELSVIVPAWNEGSFLAATLDSIATAVGALDVVTEVIVVDNNSTDDTAQVAAAAGATVVFEPINQIARARNAGAAASSGQWLVFLDADTLVSKTLLSGVLDALRQGRAAGGGSTLVPDVEVPLYARAGYSGWTWVSKTFGLAAGSFFWCRRDAFEAVGGFPETRFAGEELGLSRSIKRWGRKHNMRFEVLDVAPVVTSARKLEWYSTLELLKQTTMILVPGALRSKRMMGTWYDDSRARSSRSEKKSHTDPE